MSKSSHRTIYLLIAAIVITGLVVGGITYVLVAPPPPKGNFLTIYDWWTSGGEHAAIESLIGAFNVAYPNITVVESAVGGGAGTIMTTVVKPLVLAGKAPDSFQCHAGYEAYPYYTGGYLEPITSIWTTDNLTHYIPAVVAQMCKFGSDYYAVPVDIHRVNVLWYNLTILRSNGINPASLTTWTAFFAACDKLKANSTLAAIPGFSPIALGDSGEWAAEHVFEQMSVGIGGIKYYQDWANGKVTSATNATLLEILGNFTKYMTYINTNHAALTWDQAVARLMAGTSVFNVMGDWANGEFTAANGTGTIHWMGNYGAQPVPLTSGYYGLCVDCFQHPKGVADPANSLLWCGFVASKAGQDAFNPDKGSIAARNDSNEALYGPYQRLEAFPEFHNATYMYPSFTHGSALPPPVSADMVTAIGTLMASAMGHSDILACATTMTTSMTTNAAQFTTVWSLY